MLEVLVDSGLLGIVALGEHGSNATTGLGRRAMQGLVESGITSLILALEGRSGGNHVEGLSGFRGDDLEVERDCQSLNLGQDSTDEQGEKRPDARGQERDGNGRGALGPHMRFHSPRRFYFAPRAAPDKDGDVN